MSQVASQVGLVANRSLALPAAATEASRQRDAFQLLVDTARTKGLVSLQTPGLVGQQAARTGQLLDAPLAPTPPQPAAVSPERELLQEQLDAFDAKMNAPNLLQQARDSGFRPRTRTQLDRLIDQSQRELQSRDSPANILRRFSLKMQMLDQQRKEQEGAVALGLRERTESRREATFNLTILKAEQDREDDLVSASKKLSQGYAEQLESHDVSRKSFGIFMRDLEDLAEFAVPRPEAIRRAMASLQSQGDLRDDQRAVFAGIVNSALENPGSGLVEDINIELSAKPKKTAVERALDAKEQARNDFIKKLLDPDTTEEQGLELSNEYVGNRLEIAVQVLQKTGRGRAAEALQLLHKGRGTGVIGGTAAKRSTQGIIEMQFPEP